MTLKDPNLDCLAVRKASGVRCFRGLRVPFVNSLRTEVRRGVPEGLHVGKGREWGAEASNIVVSVERVEANHWSSWLGEGASGGNGTNQSLSISVRLDTSA